ncbi:MAG: hypothetical protein C5B52_12285 [Bacteroidetes bacterium]|nr:MAG: hypothetical protein C5B52_12285 [Bacteroidota bacterium]
MNRVKEYFNFSKRERNGILALIILLLLILFLPDILPRHAEYSKADLEIFKKEIAEFMRNSDSAGENQSEQSAERNLNRKNSDPSSEAKLFEFDPNKLTVQGWLQLGVSERTTQTIQKYLSHGGKFKTADDLKKIYGLRPSDLERLLPYVKIPEPVLKNDSSDIPHENLPKFNSRKQWPISKIDLNRADSIALSSLPGIGEKLASRIIKYREKLGGFYTTNQLAEIYGLNDTLVQNLKIHSFCSVELVKKIDLNNADFDVLKAHPYIKYPLAKAIILYRKQHGAFMKPSDLKDLSMDSLALGKLLPYMAFSRANAIP